MSLNNQSPVSKRLIILDVLRGFALVGICIANCHFFSLYKLLNSETMTAIKATELDKTLKFLFYVFINGKFYTIFSLLFGIGFSILMKKEQTNSRRYSPYFLNRMTILAIIGVIHLSYIWSGDILLLYALIGLLLPLFKKVSNQKLLIISGLSLIAPIIFQIFSVATGFNSAAPFFEIQNSLCIREGIKQDNVGEFLYNMNSYSDNIIYCRQGMFLRIASLLEEFRCTKLFGLFILGFYVGRNNLHEKIGNYKGIMKNIVLYGSLVFFPLSFLYAYYSMNYTPLGDVTSVVLYVISVFPLAIVYMSTVSLFFLSTKRTKLLKAIASTGQMALSNYISQSLLGIFIFYPIGLGLGGNVGLASITLIALAIFAVQVVFSNIWLSYFAFGPLEWIWKMLTYRKRIVLRKCYVTK
ncbi:MAG: DUF418 domain-containing protein [Phocaeicola sp.]